jgi:hypothetical protein
MSESAIWSWSVLIFLGAFHGINPAMGWLFSVALGIQERNRGAVLRSLLPIAVGHAVAIAAVLAVMSAARTVIDLHTLQWTAAGVLIAFGLYRLVRSCRHRTPVGMQVNFPDLVLWSFLMASAHGAGLMVLPAVMGLEGGQASALAGHHHSAVVHGLGDSIGLGLLAVGVHTLAMLVVAGIVAVVIYEWVGLMILRKAWVNLDLLWAPALIGAGGLMLVL